MSFAEQDEERPEPADEQEFAETDDLEAGLAGLSRLAWSRLGLQELLSRVAGNAVQAIRGAEGAGLTVLEDGQPEVMVTTAPFVTAIEDIQYGLGQGPCITAAQEGRTVTSGALGSDLRWRTFGRQVARLGVHSVLALPLITPDGVVGAMNVYAHPPQSFDERAAEIGEIFAVPAAVSVQNAHFLARTQRLATHLQSLLADRQVINRAVGIVMSRSGDTEQQALNRLRALTLNGNHHDTHLAATARQIIDEAVARAHRRQSGT